MTLFELVASLVLDTSKYEEGIKGAKGKLGGLGNSIKKGAGAIAKVSAGAIAGATTAVTGFGAVAVKAGMSFDTAMSQVAATMGKTTGEITDLRDFAQEMGAKTAFSATEAAEALNYMALAGYDSEKSMKMLPSVLNLASAGAMDLATASDMVTDASSALGLTEEQTTAMIDQMAKASSKSNTSVSQLGEAMLTIGATARGVKGGTQELSTVLGVMADNGIKGAEGGTHLRNAILSLQTPTKSGTEALKQLGMTYADMYDEAGNMRSLPEIFTQMQKAMEGMNQQSKDAIISGIFNKTDLAAINALVGTSTDRWSELGAEIKDSVGSAGKMADEQLNNLQGDIVKFRSALEGVQIKVSDALTPALRSFVQEGTSGLSAITEKLGAGDLGGAVESAGETISKVLSNAITKIPDLIGAGVSLLKGLVSGMINEAPKVFGELANALPKLMEQIADSFSGADVGKTLIPKIGEIFEQIVTGFTSFLPKFVSMATEIIGSIGQGLDQGLPNLLGKLLPMVVKLTESLRENAGKMISAGLDLIVHLAQGIANSLPVLIENIPTIITNIANIINDNAPKLIVAAAKIVGTLAIGIVKAIPTLIANIPKIFEAIIAVWSALNWVNIGKNAVIMIKNGFLYLKTAIPNALRSIGESAKNAIKNINWATVGSNIVTFIKNGIVLLSKIIPMALKNIGKVAMFAIKNINWISVGKFIVQGIVKGITLVPSLIMNALINILKKGITGVKKYLGIASPSKVFRKQIGENIGKGLALGIEDMYPDVLGAMNGLNDQLYVDDFSAPLSYTNAQPSTAWDVLGAIENGSAVPVSADTGNQPIEVTLIMEMDGVATGKAVYNLYNRETQRLGMKLAGGYA